MEPIVLASSSPRRQEILKMMNIPFQVMIPNVEEDNNMTSSPIELTETLAKAKVHSIVDALSSKQVIPWVLGADTVVCLDNKIYGKPSTQEEAFDFIKSLQGKTHTVATSIVLYNGQKKSIITKTATAKVTFSAMTDQEIQFYIDTGDWHGAAGGYRIQGLASCFISKIEGTQSCIVGLPIFELYDMLKTHGYSMIN